MMPRSSHENASRRNEGKSNFNLYRNEAQIQHYHSTIGVVVSWIVAIDPTRVRFPDGAKKKIEFFLDKLPVCIYGDRAIPRWCKKNFELKA
jgi:hypothetical protein